MIKYSREKNELEGGGGREERGRREAGTHTYSYGKLLATRLTLLIRIVISVYEGCNEGMAGDAGDEDRMWVGKRTRSGSRC